jgi:esterase/lipase superfamily enzyme
VRVSTRPQYERRIVKAVVSGARGVNSRIILFLVVMLAACAPRGAITLAPEAAAVGDIVPIFVGTTRGYDPATQSFDTSRTETLSFARFDISVPPNREVGDITFPGRRAPDAARDFLTTSAVVIADAPTFRGDLATAFGARRPGDRDAVIFVHGFNNTFAEGLYRLAQLSHDLELPGVAVHYSWPSKGAALGYVADRDSALFARDGLEELIREVQLAGAENIVLVAHSMGSALLMESMRQIAIRGDQSSLDRIGGVLLISPDIDVDVFRTQALAIGKLPEPFLIFGSDRDQYLNVSARITGEPERLGNLSDVRRLADLEVTYLDVAAYNEGLGHFNLGNSPALISLMGRIGDVDAALARDRRGRTGLLPGVVLTVRNATEIILAPVAVVEQELRRP